MINIIAIPAFQDNYIWLIHNGCHAAVIDPGDADPVLAFLQQHDLQLVAILVTHHHSDHVDGIDGLLQYFPVPVHGPRRETIATVTHAVAEGDTVAVPELALEFAVLDTPGHTAGHIAYYGANSLFCGDTLFGCGCGRLFEGTPQQMHASLQKLAQLPETTQVYCAHEYTLANIRFALAVEPDNAALQARATADSATIARSQPTLPSSIGLEKRTNPFLRCDQIAVMHSAAAFAGKSLPDIISVFTAVREWKNGFR